jgi:hypothetical protein
MLCALRCVFITMPRRRCVERAHPHDVSALCCVCRCPPTADTAFVNRDDHSQLLPQAEGGVKITKGGARAKGKRHHRVVCNTTLVGLRCVA